jgi:hypothetical protein
MYAWPLLSLAIWKQELLLDTSYMRVGVQEVQRLQPDLVQSNQKVYNQACGLQS